MTTHAATRADIQARIAQHRADQRQAVIPSTAREHAALVDALLDQLLALEPEPA